MSDNNSDHVIMVTSAPNNVATSKKPPHLVVLNDGKKTQSFVSLDKPELLESFIQVKGFFVDISGDDSKAYLDFAQNVQKESIVEMFFPIHRVVSIKNLVFKSK